MLETGAMQAGRRSEEQRAVAALRPEDVFMAWLVRLPPGADVARAALAEIARIDGAALSHAGVSQLRDLFAQAAGIQPAVPPLPAQ